MAKATPTPTPAAAKAQAATNTAQQAGNATTAQQAPTRRSTAQAAVQAAAQAGGWATKVGQHGPASLATLPMLNPKRGTRCWLATYTRGTATLVATCLVTTRGTVHLDRCQVTMPGSNGQPATTTLHYVWQVTGTLASKPSKGKPCTVPTTKPGTGVQ